MILDTSAGRYAELGYAVVPNVLSADEIAGLIQSTKFEQCGSTHGRGGQPYANRQAHDIPTVRDVATAAKVIQLAPAVLGTKPFVVRAILFDKVEGANWKIPWHQDITIAVRERYDVHGYGPWSIKEGLPHVQAPTHILRNMVAVRLHLDDCGVDNAPLRVVPKSHANGRMRKADIPSLKPDDHAEALVCHAGDAILMSPLTLHASSPATSASHRRVIHIEYACCDLDAPLEWARRIS